MDTSSCAIMGGFVRLNKGLSSFKVNIRSHPSQCVRQNYRLLVQISREMVVLKHQLTVRARRPHLTLVPTTMSRKVLL